MLENTVILEYRLVISYKTFIYQTTWKNTRNSIEWKEKNRHKRIYTVWYKFYKIHKTKRTEGLVVWRCLPFHRGQQPFREGYLGPWALIVFTWGWISWLCLLGENLLNSAHLWFVHFPLCVCCILIKDYLVKYFFC